jgi:hypothetical protein
MTHESMMMFAETWIAAWNRRDIDAVLAHFAEEAQFVSPVALDFVGRPVLRNKKELEDYWRRALDRISVLELNRTFYDLCRAEEVEDFSTPSTAKQICNTERRPLAGIRGATHRFLMTTSRYSLGTTIVPSPALFIRAMRACRSSFRSLCLASSRAANAFSIGP